MWRSVDGRVRAPATARCVESTRFGRWKPRAPPTRTTAVASATAPATASVQPAATEASGSAAAHGSGGVAATQQAVPEASTPAALDTSKPGQELDTPSPQTPVASSTATVLTQW